MPQLDFSIISSQIFWLIVFFFILYTSLIHFFLTNFIKALKTRKHVVTENIYLVIKLKKQFDDRQNVFTNIIGHNLTNIKYLVEKEIFITFKRNFFADLNTLDKKVSNVLYSNLVLYDISVLKSIPSKPIF